MTLDDLAAESMISASHLSRLERGLTLPSFTVLARLAQALEISLEHFVAMEADIEALNEQLRTHLAARGVSAAAIEEIVRMRVPARRSLAAALNDERNI